jgi:hypothetical protein
VTGAAAPLAPSPQRLLARGLVAALVGAVVLVLIPLALLTALPVIDSRAAVQQTLLLFVVSSAVLLLLAPRGLLSSRTWVLAYLLLQFPIRGLYLLSAPKERPPIYAEFSPGVNLEDALTRVLLQSLVGLAALSAGYLLTRGRTAKPLVVRPDTNARRFYGLLLLATALLPLESHATTGGFIVSLPGLAASGAAAAFCYAFVLAPRQHLLPVLFGLGFTGVRVALLGSKLAVLSCLVALLVGVVARGHRGPHGTFRALRGTVMVVVAGVAALYVFAVAGGRDTQHGLQTTLSGGLNAAVSRSYGADAVMASNAYLDAGGKPLHGSTFLEVSYSWVPRALWPDKPKSFSIRYGEDVFGFSPSAGQEFFAPSYSGEWLLNFGMVGLLVGWMLFGVLLARIDALPSVAHRMLWLASAVHLVEGSLVAQFWLSLPFIAGGYWVLRSPRRNRTPWYARAFNGRRRVQEALAD